MEERKFNTKVGKAIDNALSKQVQRETEDKTSIKIYAKVSCKQEDYDDFIEEAHSRFNQYVQVWKARNYSEKYLRSKDLISTMYYLGRRFYFIVKDDIKKITVTWL